MRRILTLHILFTVVISLAGCAKAKFWQDARVRATPPAEGVKVAGPTAAATASARDFDADQLRGATLDSVGSQLEIPSLSPEIPAVAGEAVRPENEGKTSSPDGGRTHAQSEADGTAMPVYAEPDKNTGVSYHDGTIREDTVWSGRVAIRGALTIAPQATVTVEPGTVVLFYRSARQESAPLLLVHGRLLARGTAANPVRFAAPEAGAAGAWQGVVFLASEKKNLLEHCRLEGADTGVDALFSNLTVKDSHFSRCRTALRAQDSLVYLSRYTASNCDLGIGLYDSEAEISGGNFFANRAGIAARKTSLYLTGTMISDSRAEAVSAEQCTLRVAGSTFNRNAAGLALTACEGEISGNLIEKNGDYGISLTGSRVKVTANDISRNGADGIRTADSGSVAWGNSIAANGQYDIYHTGSADFRAIGNWWGEPGSAAAPARIYDRRSNPANGRVLTFPVLKARPPVQP